MNKKNIFLLAVISLLISNLALAAGDITVSVDSLTNVKGNGAMEACGTATHKAGIKPLWVTVKHDESYYSTLTAPNGKWCVVVKRWTYNGEVSADATTLTP